MLRIPWASKLEHGSIKDLIGNSEYKKYSNGTAEAATINTEPPPIGWGKDFFLSQRVNDFPQTVTAILNVPDSKDSEYLL